MNYKAFRLLSSKEVYRGGPLRLREDVISAPSGAELIRRVVDFQARAATVVPFTRQGKILLIRHYRYAVGAEMWDIPGGFIEEGETPEACAARELFEETGYEARQLSRLLSFKPEPAFNNHEIMIYAGEAVEPSHPTRQTDEEEIREIGLFTPGETLSMVLGGSIMSSWSIIGVLAAQTWRPLKPMDGS